MSDRIGPMDLRGEANGSIHRRQEIDRKLQEWTMRVEDQLMGRTAESSEKHTKNNREKGQINCTKNWPRFLRIWVQNDVLRRLFPG